MSKVFKWILYILIGLVIIVVISGAVFAGFGALRGFGNGMVRPGLRMMEPNIRMMGAYQYHNPTWVIFGGLLCLGVILLVIVGIVGLVYALTHRNQPVHNLPATQVTAPPAEVVAPTAEEVMPIRTCVNCGKPAQEEWNTCPYCGSPLA
jgi:hypothetical protein